MNAYSQSLEAKILARMEEPFAMGLLEKQAKHLTNSQELAVSREILATLQNYCINPLSPKYCVGGNGYAHSILHYRKILTQGLPAYSRDIRNGLHRAKTLDQRDFTLPCRKLKRSEN